MSQQYTPQELETFLQFSYLHHIDFETDKMRQAIQKCGLEKWKNNEVRAEAQKLGAKYIQEITSGYMPQVSIRWISDRVGYGLFAEEDLKSGAYIGEYTGIIRKNAKTYGQPLNNFLYAYPISDHLGNSLVIDASKGNPTRFINHSFKPNLQQTFAFENGFFHLIFQANTSIEKGAQLTYSYGYSYWYIRGTPEEL